MQAHDRRRAPALKLARAGVDLYLVTPHSAFFAGVAIVAVALLALFAGPSLYEVQGHGRGLLPYDSGPVYELRIADAFTLYVDEESRPKLDAFTGTVLAVLATAALMTFLLLTAARAPRRLLRFYVLAAAGLAFLSLDEFLAFHETTGHNLRFLGHLLPGDRHPDDVIVLLYALPAAAFIVYFRDILLAPGRVRLLVGGAGALFALAVVSDLGRLPSEEFAELAAGACVVGALVLLMIRHLADGLGLSWPRATPATPGSEPPPPAPPEPAARPALGAHRVARREPAGHNP